MSNFAVVNLTRRPAPRGPWPKYKETVLGRDYELSLVFCGSTRTRTLNRIHRSKDKPANVLSFPLSKNAGEIFINLDARDFNFSYLFIHGLLHLKGLDHGSRMEAEERKLLTLFGINGQSQHHRRTGHRHHLGASHCL
ncbi:MAG: rRNA maturation RNase YbeY [Candidatus Vogelbacteria bacterium CG10_big_fil_rev_8_21_14_0_10_49_38]|uniref:Endoribonuclease YbeY n=1 Tax=Candidatus Vogelbacteria bacterium CG10_big_fil_rev_8_21_14_0_10_49_38 TaxID=1975043 RepID=A0A2H0RIZ7_9BACT|nr:MAG: rRNA maturation RNase YbeY [Candidatus Vogelbacteria bacterium CG10_big_fil_rev_8_21_14_0_10_49_38]